MVESGIPFIEFDFIHLEEAILKIKAKLTFLQ